MAQEKITAELEGLLQFLKTDDAAEQDPMLEMMRWILYQMMQIELQQRLGASKGEHSDARTGYLSGTRERRFDTRLGTLNLNIPKVRKGGYVPFFLNNRKRSEKALCSVVIEAYKNGVSTRRIEKLAQAMGIENISASEVSVINHELDDMVSDFRNRQLDSMYPILWADALYEDIREDQRVVSKAVMVIQVLNMEGQREIIAIEPMPEESTDTYKDLFNNLKSRGLKNVMLVISDSHQGLKTAAKECFPDSSWQRCKVHFMRNILAKIPQQQKKYVASKLKTIWNAVDREDAVILKDAFVSEFSKRYPNAVKCLEDGFEDSIQFYAFKCFDPRKISSSNCLERVNREIRRRTRKVGIFPSSESYIRLVTSYMIEYTEDWKEGRCYIKAETIKLQIEELNKEQAA